MDTCVIQGWISPLEALLLLWEEINRCAIKLVSSAVCQLQSEPIRFGREKALSDMPSSTFDDPPELHHIHTVREI